MLTTFQMIELWVKEPSKKFRCNQGSRAGEVVAKKSHSDMLMFDNNKLPGNFRYSGIPISAEMLDWRWEEV